MRRRFAALRQNRRTSFRIREGDEAEQASFAELMIDHAFGKLCVSRANSSRRGYSPQSLRATTATLLLDSGVPIESVQDLVDHKHITTTHIYGKRQRAPKDSTSHKMPI
jgi:site-specific recombinase XerD